jgi:hypothetical protein
MRRHGLIIGVRGAADGSARAHVAGNRSELAQ